MNNGNSMVDALTYDSNSPTADNEVTIFWKCKDCGAKWDTQNEREHYDICIESDCGSENLETSFQEF